MTAQRPAGKATRAALVVTIVAVIMNMVLDLGSSGFYATFGVFILLVLSDFGGPLRTRFLAYLVTGAGGMVLISLGALAATSLAATLIITAIVTFTLAYALVLRGYVNAAYLSLLLPYIVAVTTPQPLDALPTSLGAYAGGTLIAAITAVTLWPSQPSAKLRQALGTAVTAAANLIAASPALNPRSTPDQVEARMNELTQADRTLHSLFDGNLEREGNVSARERALVRMVDDVGRLRFSLAWTSARDQDTTTADTDLLRSVHYTLTRCGSALTHDEPPSDQVLESLHTAREKHITGLPARADKLLANGEPHELIRVANTAFRYRVTSFISAMLARHSYSALGRRVPHDRKDDSHDPVRMEMTRIESASAPLRLLRADFTIRSAWFRRALQMAVAVTVAVGVIHELHLSTGFWVVLGIVASLQLTAIRSRRSALSVAAGTTVGFAVCAVLVRLIGDHMIPLICLLPVVAFLTVWFPRGKLAVPLKQAGYTVWFVLLVSLSRHDLSLQIDESRIIDVGTGLVVSLLITTLLWPRGVATQVREILDSSVRSTAEFFAAAYTYIASPMTPEDASAMTSAARRATAGRDRATEAYDLALSQGGTAEADAKDWMVVNNAVDHAFFAGAMVRGFDAYGLAPLPDTRIAAELETSARRAAEEFEATIHSGRNRDGASTAPYDDDTNVDSVDADSTVSESIEQAIASWSTDTSDMPRPTPDGDSSMPRGNAAIALLWAQNWQLYFRWMASRSRPEEPTATPG